MVRPSLVVPTAGTPRSGRRRVRLVAILAARDEERFLSGWLANVSPQVDAIVALDDGSTDATPALLASHPAVAETIRVPPERERWDEPGNHRRLVEAALRHGADWIVSVDADERLEREFRPRAERAIARGRPLGCSGYSVRLRELWGAPDRYRADGVWRHKTVARLFAARADHAFDPRPLHAHKAPLQAHRRLVGFPAADLVVYHLRMVEPADREARRRRYELADPGAHHQPDLGYAYLTDESGLELRPVPERRGWVEGPR